MNLTRTAILSLSILLAACSSDDDGGNMDMGPTGPSASLSSIDTSGGTDGIVALPMNVDARILAVFERYAELTAPNGRRVHFLAQTGVSDELIFRTRGIIRQHLFEVDGTTLGTDKSGVFNRMGLRGAVIAIISSPAAFSDVDPDVMAFQDFFGDTFDTVDASQMVMEASANYLLPSPANDPTIGQCAAIVLRQGLSTQVPSFQTALDAATDNAVMNGLYTPPMSVPADRIDDEYLALAMDTYYGIWGHDPNSDGTAGAGSEYDFNLRTDMEASDAGMVAVIESFFSPTHRYPAFLDESFNGSFEMTFDGILPYTHRSQYLERAGVRGTSTARINGNELDNTFIGNDVGTVFEGKGGNDAIDSNDGPDELILTGNFADYLITNPEPTITRIEDTVMNRDGIDDLRGIVTVQFADGPVNL